LAVISERSEAGIVVFSADTQEKLFALGKKLLIDPGVAYSTIAPILQRF
jgi:hypothetical protein